jgi:hypothetical protein
MPSETLTWKLTDLVVVQAGVLSLDLVVLVLPIQDVGIGRARDLDLRRRNVLPSRVPNGDVSHDGDVRAHHFLGTENPNLIIVGIAGKHHVLAQKLAD